MPVKKRTCRPRNIRPAENLLQEFPYKFSSLYIKRWRGGQYCSTGIPIHRDFRLAGIERDDGLLVRGLGRAQCFAPKGAAAAGAAKSKKRTAPARRWLHQRKSPASGVLPFCGRASKERSAPVAVHAYGRPRKSAPDPARSLERFDSPSRRLRPCGAPKARLTPAGSRSCCAPGPCARRPGRS
jgi:hypothetical protein